MFKIFNDNNIKKWGKAFVARHKLMTTIQCLVTPKERLKERGLKTPIQSIEVLKIPLTAVANNKVAPSLPLLNNCHMRLQLASGTANGRLSFSIRAGSQVNTPTQSICGTPIKNNTLSHMVLRRDHAKLNAQARGETE